MTEEPGTLPIVQANRDYVARVMDYFASLPKRAKCPPAAAITASFPNDIQGLTTNRTAETAVRVIFKTAKHIISMCNFVEETRLTQNNIILRISMDGSSFHSIK